MLIFEIVVLSLAFIPFIVVGIFLLFHVAMEVLLIKSAGETILRYSPTCEVCGQKNFEVTIIEAIPTIEVENLELYNGWYANEVTSII